MSARIEFAAGRFLSAPLFLADTARKALRADATQALLVGFGLPDWLIWPALAFKAGEGFLLIANLHPRPLGRALALHGLVDHDLRPPEK